MDQIFTQKAAEIREDRKDWILRRCDSFEDMRTQAVRDWQQVSATERSDAAWQLVVSAWNLKKCDPDELRLHRVITVLHKA